MKLFHQDKQISFREFAEDFPKEAAILENYQEMPWSFAIDDAKLSFLHGEFKGISINPSQVLSDYKTYYFKNSFYQEQLAKALGIKKGKPRGRICDATGGLLGDTLKMVSYECLDISVYERHPVAAALIQNALCQNDLPIQFHFGEFDHKKEFEVILFDPMYADKNTKSAPKKEMQIFRDIVGEDTDACVAACKLRESAIERLVIKRPIKSELLLADVSHQIKGKSTRFDVYMKV